MHGRPWQRITELFEEALPLSESDRGIFLREACGGDEKLRRTVASLLEADSEAGDFLETPLPQLLRYRETSGPVFPMTEGHRRKILEKNSVW